MRLHAVRVTNYLKDTLTVTDLHSEMKACRYCSVAPPAEWKSLSDCPSYVPHRPSVWLQSELGALSVRLIPQSDTSARTNAPDEKVNCGGDKDSEASRGENEKVIFNEQPAGQADGFGKA